ncbi:MAG: glycosyl hydrolase, partial [Acidobacteria bacterium]
KGLLYAGTQHGFYVSFNDGDEWQSLSLNLPDTQVSDIAVEANDIAIATHGRGFYILDNIAAIRQAGPAVTSTSDFYLFAPGDAIRSTGGATITYLLKKPAQNLALDILDSKGELVRSIPGAAPGAGRGGRGRGAGREGAPPAETTATQGRAAAAAEAGGAGAETAQEEGGGGRGRGGNPTASLAAGLNRFTWDLQYPPATMFPDMVIWGASTNGPTALPGAYQVRLTVDGRSQTQPLTIRRHPLHGVSDADLREQFDLAVQIRDKVSEANNAVIQIRKVKQGVADRLAKSSDSDLKAAAGRLTKNLSTVEEDVYQVRNQSGQDPLNFPIKTNNRLASLLRVVTAGEGKPIGNAVPIFNDLKAELKAEMDRLQQVLQSDLPTFNSLAKKLGLEPVADK